MGDEIERNDFRTDRSRKARKLLRTLLATALVATSLSPLARSPAMAQQANTAKPNILVIFGDDIGQTNISAYADGLVGYKTPNIDRIAKEGMMLHRLLCREQLHGGSLDLHHRADLPADRAVQGRHSRRHGRPAGS